MDDGSVTRGIQRIMSDIFLGPAGEGAWILNPTDAGLLDTIDGLTAAQASMKPIPDRSSLAGHVDHLLFSLRLLSRWAKGENPYGDADWESSWQRQQVSDVDWGKMRADLRAEVVAVIAVFDSPIEMDEIGLTGAIAAPAHAAYHLGAIRQLLGMLDG